MRKLVLLRASLFMMVLLIAASPVRAQNVTWVGPDGSDSNPCTQTLPCATFLGAYQFRNASQINCLGSGNYGPIIITGSLTIDCGAGNVGNIVVANESIAQGGDAAITIETSTEATIILRHLALTNLGPFAALGIITKTFATGTVIIEDCTVQGFSGVGISFTPPFGRGLLQVSNSLISGNLGGIEVLPSGSAIASVTLNRVELVGNSGGGLVFQGNVVAGTMRHSVVVGNGSAGVLVESSQAFFTIEETSIVDNLVNGIQTNSAGAVVNVGSSTIGGNGTGVLASQGSIISFGNNQMSTNATNGNFTSTTALQ